MKLRGGIAALGQWRKKRSRFRVVTGFLCAFAVSQRIGARRIAKQQQRDQRAMKAKFARPVLNVLDDLRLLRCVAKLSRGGLTVAL